MKRNKWDADPVCHTTQIKLPFPTALIAQHLSAWIFPRIQIKTLDSYFRIQHLYKYLKSYSIRGAEKMESVHGGSELALHI